MPCQSVTFDKKLASQMVPRINGETNTGANVSPCQLLVAGNETTPNGIAVGIQMLACCKALHQRLKNNPELIKEFVEEVLRTEAVVMVHYGAASRNEFRFDNADMFDLERPMKTAHLAFGSGIHYCIGSELARVEMAAAFSAFTHRFSSINQIDEDVTYHSTFTLRCIN